MRPSRPILLPVLLLLLALPPAAGAGETASAAAPKLGCVNLALLYALHPEMRFYVPSEGRFLNVEEGTDFAARAKRNEAMILDLTRRIADIGRALERDEARREEARREHHRRRERILSDMRSTRDNPANLGRTFDFSKEEATLREIDADLSRALAGAERERAERHAEAAALDEELKALNYHTGAAHAAKVDEIVAEVAAAVGAAAERHGIAAVLNASRPRAPHAPPAAGPGRPLEVHDPASAPRPTNLYGGGRDLGEMIGLHGGVEGAKDFLDRKLDDYARRVRESPALLEPFRDAGVDSFLFAGGEDLTAEALAELLGRRGVEKELVELLVAGVRNGTLR